MSGQQCEQHVISIEVDYSITLHTFNLVSIGNKLIKCKEYNTYSYTIVF